MKIDDCYEKLSMRIKQNNILRECLVQDWGLVWGEQTTLSCESQNFEVDKSYTYHILRFLVLINLKNRHDFTHTHTHMKLLWYLTWKWPWAGGSSGMCSSSVCRYITRWLSFYDFIMIIKFWSMYTCSLAYLVIIYRRTVSMYCCE